MLQYAIFDMDGTLTDSMGVWEEAPYRMLAKHGFSAGPELRARLVELTQEDGLRIMLAEFPLNLTLEQAMEEFYAAAMEGYETITLKPGAEQALRRLAAAGVKMAVASSTRKETVDAVLTRLGVRELFVDTYSCRDGYGKLAGPYVYFDALAGLGQTDPGCCYVFEDAYHCLQTASAAGFPVIGVYDRFCTAAPAEAAALCRLYLNSWDEFDITRL